MQRLFPLLSQALCAALSAGSAILRVYASPSPKVDLKEDLSPLTQADRDAHRIIAGTLTPLGLPLLSEEGRSIPFSERGSWEDFWLVDPLDGTKEFLKKNGEFTVNIALISKGSPVLGVVYAPALKALYFAGLGIGAFKAAELPSPEEAGNLLLPRSPSALRLPTPGSEKPGFTRVVASRSHMDPATQAFVDGIQGPVDLVTSGSSLKFCLVAEGSAEVYPRYAPTMEWDTAAGQAVVEAAGGKVVDAITGEPLRYNKEDLHNPNFIARR